MPNESGGPQRLFARLLTTYARPFAALIALTMLLSGVAAGASYLRAYLIKPILDDVLVPARGLPDPVEGWLLSGGSDTPDLAAQAPEAAEVEARVRDSLLEVAAFALIVIALLPSVGFARNYLTEHVLGRIYIDLQRDLCAKLLALPMRYHDEQRRGDLLSRTLQDVRTAHGATGLVFDDFVEAVLMTGVGAAVLIFISWQLAAIFLVLGPLLFGVIALFTRRISRSARRRQEKFGDVTQRLIEILEGIKVIKAFRAEAAEDRAFRSETGKLFKRSMKVVKNRLLARGLTDALNNAMAIGTILLGAALVLGGRWGLSMGDLAAFAAVLATTYRPLRTLARGWVRLADAQPSVERFFEVLDSPLEISDAREAGTLDKVREGIRLDRVGFSYGREPVLRDISLDVRCGEVVAIVGATGAGKTTLADLLLRFHDPTHGTIEIDGVDLRDIRRDSLYEHIAVVTQDPFLFDAPILENIRFGRPGASDDEVEAAGRAAHVDEFVQQLPDGYATEVGAAGVRLSGGQRQRVTIARAILKDPAILIFDEATSSLDSRSEQHVQQAVEALLGGRTVFLIAHRLSTVRNADRIVVLENGTISQSGTHDSLVESGGLYRELIELQNA
jgi:subfamily B ATP-binding cassette protein MsbA